MNEGWIKLHRKILDHPRSSDPNWFSLFAHLLLLATHKEIKMIFDGAIIELKPGQLITSRSSLSKKTGVHRSSVERLLRSMEIEHEIEQATTSTSRLITILNWAAYQSLEPPDEQRASSERATSEPPLSTNKNVKNERIGTGSTGVGRDAPPVIVPWETPTLEQWLTNATFIGYDPAEAETAWNGLEAVGWEKDGQPVRYWRRLQVVYRDRHRERQHKERQREKHQSTHKPGMPGSGNTIAQNRNASIVGADRTAAEFIKEGYAPENPPS